MSASTGRDSVRALELALATAREELRIATANANRYREETSAEIHRLSRLAERYRQERDEALARLKASERGEA